MVPGPERLTNARAECPTHTQRAAPTHTQRDAPTHTQRDAPTHTRRDAAVDAGRDAAADAERDAAADAGRDAPGGSPAIGGRDLHAARAPDRSMLAAVRRLAWNARVVRGLVVAITTPRSRTRRRLGACGGGRDRRGCDGRPVAVPGCAAYAVGLGRALADRRSASTTTAAASRGIPTGQASVRNSGNATPAWSTCHVTTGARVQPCPRTRP